MILKYETLESSESLAELCTAVNTLRSYLSSSRKYRPKEKDRLLLQGIPQIGFVFKPLYQAVKNYTFQKTRFNKY